MKTIFLFHCRRCSAWRYRCALSLSDCPRSGLVPYEIVDGNSIPKSLTGVAGDAANGRKIAIAGKREIALHVM